MLSLQPIPVWDNYKLQISMILLWVFHNFDLIVVLMSN